MQMSKSTILGASLSWLAFLPGIIASPTLTRRATLLESLEDAEADYDYVIIGGGTSGLTVGDRLSESGEYSVLAIEYGHLEPDGYRPGRTTYNITSQPSPELNDRSFDVAVGCIVGGSSAVNGQVFQRGTAADYDIWGELGEQDSTWTWESLLSYFKKGIHFNPPNEEIAEAYNITYDPEAWGQDPETHIYATYSLSLNPDIITIYDAMKAFPGISVPLDAANGQNGLSWFTTSMDPESFNRSYARTGHWDNLERENYHLVTGAKGQKIIFEDDLAVGVQVHARDNPEDTMIIKAKKEVILAAGAIHTPQILQLSGIGPAELLEEAGIEVKVDLPGVGMNFQDHYYVPGVSFRWGEKPPTPSVDVEAEGGGFGIALAAFLGMKAISPESVESIADALEAQNAAEYLPANTHPSIISGYSKQKALYARSMRDNALSFFVGYLGASLGTSPQHVHPLSRGTVKINVTDPEAETIVDYRAASNPVDIDIMVECIKFLRRFATTESLAEFNATALSPEVETYEDDETLAAWVRETMIPSVYHPVGTAAKMPLEDGGVVSDTLQVWGVNGLSVVDASIMPTIVGGTTSMTVYAMAEKAADLIKARA